MNKRTEVFCQFNPKLVEALSYMVLDELNILRQEHGLPPRTKQQAYDEITNHFTTLEDYDLTP